MQWEDNILNAEGERDVEKIVSPAGFGYLINM